MKKIFYVSFMFIAIISMIGCNGKGKKTAQLNDKEVSMVKTLTARSIVTGKQIGRAHV